MSNENLRPIDEKPRRKDMSLELLNEMLRLQEYYSSSSNYYSNKSVVLAILLTLFLGPFGMFYSTTKGAIIMITICVILLFLTSWAWIFVTWPINVIWAALSVQE